MSEEILKLSEWTEILKLIGDLGWEYDRMSSSGKETYDKLTNLLEDTDG